MDNRDRDFTVNKGMKLSVLREDEVKGGTTGEKGARRQRKKKKTKRKKKKRKTVRDKKDSNVFRYDVIRRRDAPV